ncbi:hypothetical protein LJK87_07990 [Paenibacillus sp. P25]|nr:hypothetical protein LJK87_07990 [Paenibacillus sp. P25]
MKSRFVYQDDEELDKGFDWNQMKRLGKYMRPYAKQILPMILLMMAVGALTKLLNPAADRLCDRPCAEGKGRPVAGALRSRHARTLRYPVGGEQLPDPVYE